MKKIYLLFLILFAFTTSVTVAQSSHDKISYQSVVRDGNNHLLYDTSVTVVVTIKNSGDPAVKYRETHTVMSNTNGLISFLIGGGSNPSGNWDAVQWNRAEITMETSVGGTALSTYTLPLSAVPYALYAKNAATSDYADSVDLDVVQHFIETSGYLTDELQVLSISNDTIFLSQGGWVKLPVGFSGDYNDLINKPDLKPVATSGDYNDLVNKPENLVQDANYVHTDNNYTTAEKNKLAGIEAGAEVNVQSDWEQDDQSADDFIKNKPDLSQYATKNALRDTAGNIRSALVDTASDIRDALVDTAAAIRADMGDAAHDAKITIQKNGQNVGDFTLNQATDDTVNILVPTKVTDLEDAGNYVTKAKLNDTLNRYTTSNKIDTLLGNYATTTYVKDTLKAYFDTTLTKKAIHDTANALRGEFPTVNNGKITIAMNRGTVDQATFYVNQDGEQTVMINLPDETLVNNGQLTIITDGDTTRFTANQSGNDTVNLSGFVTTARLNDTLKAYTTTDKIDTIVNKHHFLTSDSALIVRMRDSIQKVNAHVSADSLVLATRMDTLLKHVCDTVKPCVTGWINDTLKAYTTTNEIDTIVNKYHFLTSDSALIVRMRDSIQKVNAHVSADSLVLATRMDTLLKHVCDSVKPCVTDWMNDTLKAYTTTDEIDTIINKHHFLTSDSALIVRMRDSIQKVNAHVSADSLVLATRMDTLLKHVCDSVKPCVTDWMNDTLKAYTTTDEIDTIINKHHFLTSDSALIVRMRDSIQVNATAIQANATNIGINKQAIIDSSAHIRNDIKNGQITIAVNRSTTTTETTVTHPTFGVNQVNDQTVTITIPQETTVNNGQLTIVAAGDTTRFTANQANNDTMRLNKFATKDTLKNFVNKLAIRDSVNNIVKDSLAASNSAINMAIDTIARHNISDSTRMVFDTLHKYYATKDTLKNFVNKLAIRDSVNNIVKDSLAAPNSAINIAIDTIARHNISDSTRMVFDTLHKYYATKDTLKNFVNKLAIRDSVNNIVKDSLSAPNSAINMAIDTIARHNISDSTRMVFDTLHNYYATKDTLKNFVNKLAIRDSVNNIVKDSLAAPNSAINIAIDTIARHNISDSTRMVFDTLHKYYATKDTLKNFVNKLAIRDSVNNIVKDSLAAPNSAINIAIDTIARHNISDSTRMVFDTLHKYYATKDTLKNFVNKLAIRDSVNNIVKDSLAAPNSAINKAIDTIARNNIHDTAMAIRNSIGNGQITFQKNGTAIDNGSFKLNQKENETINITVPTTVAELTDAGNYATKAGDNPFSGDNTFSGNNSFSGKNHFSDSVTVPSNDAIKRPTMTSPTTCDNMNAVNVCDLLAVFDSLTKRIDALQEELDALKSATPPTVSVSLSEVQYTSMKAIATASGNGANITSYKFCISTSSDMSGAQCFTSSSNEYTFTGLEANTLYYVTADATNMVGTTTSDVVSKRTAMHAPTGTFALESIAPTGFKVMVSALDFKEPGAGTVQICYKKKEGDCPTNFTSYTDCDNILNIASGITDTLRKFINVDNEAGVEYCVIVKLMNGDSVTVLEPLSITTGAAISLDITYTPTTLNLCGGSLDVTYTATTNPSSVDLNDFENFTWTDGTSTDNTTVVTYSTGGTKNITCTATHKTEGYTITGNSSVDVINTGSGPAFTFCVDSLTVNITSITSGTTNLNWGDGSADESNPSTSSYNNYATDGVYSIVATNSSGCSTTKQAAVGIATLHPCTVTSINANEQGSGTTINTLQDVDGNLYAVVQIGKQCWMKSNLRTTHYSDGTEIANGTGSGTNNTTSHTTAYYYRPVASSNFDDSYDFSMYNFKTDGLYYNWKATMHGAASSTTVPSRVQGVCPTGWHVPSVREWDTLFAFVQTLPNATYWDLHPIGYAHAIAGGCEWVPAIDGLPGYYQAPAWNISEFSMVPAGEAGGSFKYNVSYEPYASPQEAEFWTSKEADAFANSPQAWTYAFYAGEQSARLGKSYSSQGSSVRCVRDYESGSPISDPYVTTENATNVDYTTATLNGSVVNPDNQNVTSKGFEWKLSTATDYTSSVTVTDGAFTHNLSGLTEGTSYTYRAFITHSGWTVYGEEVTFMTLKVPTVHTEVPTNLGVTSATLQGTFSNESGLPIEPMGFEWKLNSEPETEFVAVNSVTVSDDEMTYNFAGLTAATSYDYKAFITHESVRKYGDVVTFTTLTPPTVLTNPASDISTNTATLNGTVNNPSGVPIDAQGFKYRIYGESSYTTVSGTITESTLSATLSLLPDTTYYFKSFITYGDTTVYGNETDSTFTTKQEPTVVTENETNVGETIATLNGSITNPDDVSITAKGFEWKLKTADKYDTVYALGDDLTYDLANLTANTEYVFRAFVNFDGKTVYDADSMFKTLMPAPTLSIKSNAPSSLSVCNGGSTEVTYSAVVTVGEDTLDCDSYSWSILPSCVSYTTNDSICTVVYSAGTYTVSCTATHNLDNISVTGTYLQTVSSSSGNATAQPCTVVSKNPNEQGTETSINSLQDVDGNWYGVVQIGSQCWMKSNLRTTRYDDDNRTPIDNGTDSQGNITIASNFSQGYYYKPTVNNTNSSKRYDYGYYDEVEDGLYYNWKAVVKTDGVSPLAPIGVMGVCPKGWHVPSIAEWDTLINYVKKQVGDTYATRLAGGCSDDDWISSGTSGRPGYYSDQNRNFFGLSLTPAGFVDNYYECFSNNGVSDSYQCAYFWSCSKSYQQGTTTIESTRAQIKYLKANQTQLNPQPGTVQRENRKCGFSVRCVRDPQVNIELSVDYPSPALCGENPATVTYTVAVTKNGVPVTGNGYSWSVKDGDATLSTGNTNPYTVTYTTASTYQVSCTVTNTAEGINKVVTRNTVVAPSGSAPYVTYCDEDSTITLKKVVGSPASLAWGDGQSITSGIAIGTSHTYAAPGVYDLVVAGSNGCITRQTVGIAGASVVPCTVPSTHLAQTGITGGGHNGAKDGLETVNGDGEITSVTDYDGNVYSVVQIGSQCWLAENLRCTHSPSTDTCILNPEGRTGNNASITKSSKTAHWWKNESGHKYGMLYNWCAAVDTFYKSGGAPELANGTSMNWQPVIGENRRGICPKGWHIPSMAEWQTFKSNVNNAGEVSKGCDWNSCNACTDLKPGNYNNPARNSKRFGAIPAGTVTPEDAEFWSYTSDAWFWSTTQQNDEQANICNLKANEVEVLVGSGYKTWKSYCHSVRCVRDAETGN